MLREQFALRSPTSLVRRSGWSTFFRSSPARSALLVFTALIFVWTALLALPFSSQHGTVTNLADALKEQGKEVEFYAYNASHSFGVGSVAYNLLMQRSIAFFDSRLGQ